MNAKTLLAATLAALLLVPIANAQPSRDPSIKEPKPEKQAVNPNLPAFPNATRKDSDEKPGSKAKTKLNKINAQLQSQQFPEAIAGAEAILSDPKSSPIEKAWAAQYATFAARDNDEIERAIGFATQALDLDVLPNAYHFQLMLELASLQSRSDKFTEALATLDRYLADTKSADPQAHLLRGQAYYEMDKYAEAIDALKLAVGPDGKASDNVNALLMHSYLGAERYPEAIAMAEQTAAAAPNDKKAQLNLAAIYAQAEQPAKAVAIFERLRNAKQLTDTKDYEAGISVLNQLDGREADLVAFINDGLAKGVLKPSSNVYGVLGQAYYGMDNLAEAIAAWGKGAPLSPNGELFLNLAVISNQADKYAEAKAAAQQAIAKGVRKPGKAWMVIAEAEQGLGSGNAAIAAAYREAAKDPATRDDAQKMLKNFGGK
jgi:tetratricopeptide (TPR) repeat protein